MKDFFSSILAIGVIILLAIGMYYVVIIILSISYKVAVFLLPVIIVIGVISAIGASARST